MCLTRDNLCYFSQEEYFDNIIGVTKEYNTNTAKDYLLTKEEYKVVLGIFSSKTWGIVNTRPLHRSQRVEMEFDRGKSYGEISITVIINIEMYLSILSIGRDISIVRPTFAKAEMLKMLKDIMSNYWRCCFKLNKRFIRDRIIEKPEEKSWGIHKSDLAR